jgi:hypothetical protein
MSRVIIVEVGDKDLADHYNTRERDCSTCPVARALIRATKLPWKVSRSGAYTKRYGRTAFPEEVTQWIDRLDAHLRVAPITFSIQVLPQEIN